MTLRTFQAPTMAEALAKVKKDLGKDAVILHTRAYKKGRILGLFGRPQVEIVASVGVNVMGPREVRGRYAPAAGGGNGPGTAPVAAPLSALERAYGAPPRSSGGALRTAPPAPITAGAPAEHDAAARPTARAAVAGANAVGSAGMSADLREELAAIKIMVGQVLQSSAVPGVGGAGAGGAACMATAMPDVLLHYYLKLIQSDVAREIADRVVADIRDELTPRELADEQIVRQSVLRRIESLIPADNDLAPPVRQPDGRPQTIALIGPTGVGKTTTIAKLAATYRLRYGRKVGLVTADTYRIAAVDQLRTYANIIGVPLRVALNAQEMAQACAGFAEMDAILIDTAGRSPGDGHRLDELAGVLRAANPHQTHLVLASVAGESALLRTLDRFAPLGASRLIFTKLDEAAGFGVLLNVLRRTKARLSFITTGQEVPDDIEPGRPDHLARLVLDGLTPRTDESAGAKQGGLCA